MNSPTKSDNFPGLVLNSGSVRLTRFDRWWASLLPAAIKKVLPPWQISAGLVTLMSFYTEDQVLTTMVMLLWASMSFTWLFKKFSKQIGHLRFIIPAYHAMLYPLVVMPAYAQAAGNGCSTSGLFSQVTNFVNQLFSSITFGGMGGGTLSNLICQVIGFLTVSLLLGFLGVIGYVAFQIGHQRQPISTVLDPVMGFLIFAGGSTIVIGVMVGTGGAGA